MGFWVKASSSFKRLQREHPDVVFLIFMRAAAVKNVGCTLSISGGRVFYQRDDQREEKTSWFHQAFREEKMI